MQNSRVQGGEGGETGGREEDAGADSKIKEDEEEDRDGERERNQEQGRREPDREEEKRKAEVKVHRSTHPPNPSHLEKKQTLNLSSVSHTNLTNSCLGTTIA